MMLHDGVVDLAGASWLATANYLGYWLGALACALQPTMWRRWGLHRPLRHTAVVRAGLVAVDDKTLEYIKGRPLAPTGFEWEQAVAYWKTLQSDPDAKFDAVVELDAAQIIPQVTWGTSPEMVLGVDARVPDPDKEKDANKRGAIERALTYMGLTPGKPINDITIDRHK